MWGHRLKGLSWRIDVKTKARHIDQLNQPTAIMEMQLSREGSDKVHVNVVSSEVHISLNHLQSLDMFLWRLKKDFLIMLFEGHGSLVSVA